MRWSLFALALVTGCAGGMETSIETQALFGGGLCEGLVCPGNSDIFAALQPNEISLDKTDVSKRGFSLVGVTHNGLAMPAFDVSGAQLIGVDPATKLPLSGGAMINTVIRLHHTSGDDIDLWVVTSTPVPYYGDVGPLPQIWGYWIKYRTVAGGEHESWKDICPYPTHYDGGVQGTWAVFWKGDRYDPDTGVIYEIPDKTTPWFNLSCAGESLIKMLRTGTGGINAATTRDQRNATMNMFTAKYCHDDDTRYTHLGVDLDWDDKTGSNSLPPIGDYTEAIWGPTGAVCFNPSHQRAPEDGIPACRLPTCTSDQETHWETYGWTRSGGSLLVVAK